LLSIFYLIKLGATPLEDNDPRDMYLYEVVFYTGHSASSGTTGNVYMILEGTIEETAPKAMKDPVRVKFTKSATDTFLLAVPSSLGRLKSLRVWHDNSGQSPGNDKNNLKAFFYINYSTVEPILMEIQYL
jgi:hypothetical protein